MLCLQLVCIAEAKIHVMSLGCVTIELVHTKEIMIAMHDKNIDSLDFEF